jgi:hypothetical protein
MNLLVLALNGVPSWLGYGTLRDKLTLFKQYISLSCYNITMNDKKIWKQLIEHARYAPSPHNTQPWRIKVTNANNAEIYYVPKRLLPDTDPTGCFLRVGLGVFLETLDVTAQNFGYRVSYDSKTINEFKFKSEKLEFLCKISLEKSSQKPKFPLSTIKERKTARGNYDSRKISEGILKSFSTLAEEHGSKIDFSNDPKLISWLIKINRDTVFDDMYDGRTRKEISKWVRFSKKHATKKHDGLSSESMGFLPITMWFFFKLSWLFRLPLLKQMIYRIYLNHTKITPTMGWIQGPFESKVEQIQAGHMLAQLWLLMAHENVYMHPFGSLITNIKSKVKLSEMLSLDRPQDLWLIVRVGYSTEPPQSERLPVEEIIIS